MSTIIRPSTFGNFKKITSNFFKGNSFDFTRIYVSKDKNPLFSIYNNLKYFYLLNNAN